MARDIFKVDVFFSNIILHILFMPYVYSRPYVLMFIQGPTFILFAKICQTLRLFRALFKMCETFAAKIMVPQY